ncbi:MAG: hypothetical protein NT062_39000, partial [Proteobacteria bacterium]|nr:hypothetical protein [Pseudomonadota bacterium]
SLAAVDDPDPRFDAMCGELRCQIGNTATDAEARTHALYLADRWRPHPDVVVDAGVRVEAQDLYYPDDLRGRIDPLTGTRVGDVAIALRHAVEPRLGIAVDPTSTGRARLLLHVGRYADLLPLGLVDRYFTRTTLIQQISLGNVGNVVSERPRLVVGPELEAGQLDELLAGGELELVPGVVLGASWRHRRLHRIVEDVAFGDGYRLENPPAARRDHDAVILAIAARLDALRLVASYTRARASGTSLTDDHTSPAFDGDSVEAIDLAGVLDADRTHDVKLDASYTRRGLTFGVRVRAQSGTPITATVSGVNVLAPGALGRTPFSTGLDTHLGYRRPLTARVTGEIYVDVVNLVDAQTVTAVDARYADSRVAVPIAGGTYADLIWLRLEDHTSWSHNANFGKPTNRNAPRAVTLGARLTF